jgi:chemotaxis signal transduction protein
MIIMAVNIVPVRLNGMWVAVPAEAVQEVVGRRPWTAIPTAPPDIPGVLPWRGRAIALVDLGRVTGLGALSANETRARHVVLQLSGCTMALPVDAVREVQLVADEHLRAAEATQMRFSPSEIVLDGAPIPLIDVSELVRALGGEA